ncbi:MAG TPA: HNH endonuclease [Methanomassiliicoccales archaeon]|nr:HNH endonuclease [Methanomassiliicoccales archaeon]
MLTSGDVITYWQICAEEGFGLQRGMYYKPRGKTSVLLMSIRRGAPYADRVEDGGRVLIYEGHDSPKKGGVVDPKSLDQPFEIEGKPTQNSLFFQAAKRHSENGQLPELVKVYEKIRQKLWVYDGIFHLVDAWVESSGTRRVFKFKLLLLENQSSSEKASNLVEEAPRMIPSSVKVEVWKRDKGKCVNCGAIQDLHFDHVIPYSKGGSSLVLSNIQILCSKCNIAKSDRIE